MLAGDAALACAGAGAGSAGLAALGADAVVAGAAGVAGDGETTETRVTGEAVAVGLDAAVMAEIAVTGVTGVTVELTLTMSASGDEGALTSIPGTGSLDGPPLAANATPAPTATMPKAPVTIHVDCVAITCSSPSCAAARALPRASDPSIVSRGEPFRRGS